MNEIAQNLWLGDLSSALNTQQLRENKIHSILSVMRGKIKINETFIRHRIELDDVWDAEILSQFLPAIHFIRGELEKGRGVLVHCLAGISRSPTIVAAYLMYTLNITPDDALTMILKQRPFVQPNQNFLRQLDLFHQSQGKVSRNDKDIRRFYLERTVHEVVEGNGSRLTTEMLSNLPNLPTNSELGITTRSKTTLTTPIALRQRRIRCKMCRQDLATREHMLDHGQLGPLIPSAPSTSSLATQRPSDSEPQLKIASQSALDPSFDVPTSQQSSTEHNGKSASDSNRNAPVVLLPSVQPISDSRSEVGDSIDGTASATHPKGPLDLASGLYTNPKSATFQIQSPLSRHPSDPSQVVPNIQHATQSGPPILSNPKCSGYFVEPMKWMDPFLSAGSLVGKIICPNKKCNAKLGNYDWAGVCCGCKIWVTPGFCINRSKVDEIA